jgi:gluconate 2-dehydrogenase gamma chain
MQIDRRLFLLSSAAATALYAGPLVTFTSDEARIVEALADQAIPADGSPGAKQAGVLFYIDKQLAGPLQRFAANYQRAIPQFQAACLEKTGKDFPSLPFAEQTAFLHSLDGPMAAFFNMVIDHTMQGFYGSPIHGGNLDEASWKMLGIQGVMGGHRH